MLRSGDRVQVAAKAVNLVRSFGPCRTRRFSEPLLGMRARLRQPDSGDPGAAFSAFMTDTEPRIQRALRAGYGPEIGREATLEAFEYGWEHWNRIGAMSNPAGYLYRVGAHCAARLARNRGSMVLTTEVPTMSEPWVEPGLDGALDVLSGPQRTAVVLIHGFGWTYQEVSDLLGVRRSTVQRHTARAMSKLRSELEVHDAIA